MTTRKEYLVTGLITLCFGFVAAFAAGVHVRNAILLAGIVMIVVGFAKNPDGRADG
jgi:uncharacterized membrane protein HdeD (DUF308 family)